jgi:hypothetical protein
LSGGVEVWASAPLIRHGVVPPEVEGIFEVPSTKVIVRGEPLPQTTVRLPAHVPAGNAIFTPTVAGTTTSGNPLVFSVPLGRPVKVIPPHTPPPVTVADCNRGTPPVTLTSAVTVQDVHSGRLLRTSSVPEKVWVPSGLAAWAIPGAVKASAAAQITENFFISTLLFAIKLYSSIKANRCISKIISRYKIVNIKY